MTYSKYEPPGSDYWLEIKYYLRDEWAHNKSLYFHIWYRDEFVGSAFTDIEKVRINLQRNISMSTAKASIAIIEQYLSQRKP